MRNDGQLPQSCFFHVSERCLYKKTISESSLSLRSLKAMLWSFEYCPMRSLYIYNVLTDCIVLLTKASLSSYDL